MVNTDMAGLFASPEPAQSPVMLLRADAAVVPLRGRSRHELLDELVGWCTDTQPFGARLLAGARGQGKTRLGEELIRRVSAAGWVAGRVVDRPPADAEAALARLDRPVLLVVDRAAARREQLGPLMTAARGCGQPARLLLLARTGGESMFAAAAEPQLSSITTAPTRWLEPVTDEPDDRLDAWREAATALASRLVRMPGYQHIDWTAAADRAVTTPARLTGHRFAALLDLHMDALAAVLQAGQPIATPAAATHEDVLLLHEQRHWRRTSDTHGLGALDDTALRRCVTVAALWTAPDRRLAETLARAIPDLGDGNDGGPAAVVDWLASLYPAANRCWAPLQPDRLAEHLIATELATQPTLATTTAAVVDTDQWHHALTVLSDAAIDHPDLDPVITDLITAWPGTATAVAARVATQVERPAPLITALTVIADQLTDESIDLLAAIGAAMPLYGPEHRDFTIRFAQRLVTVYRARAHARPDAFEPDLAASLKNLSQHLGTLGRVEEALAASEEATTIHRRLAATRPDVFEPDLAASLSVVAAYLGQLRRREEAVAAMEEATAIHRRLAATRPEAFEPELASSLWGLSVQFGPGEAGLAVLEEVIPLYRRLAATRPDAFEPQLASALGNLMVYLLVHPARRGEALAATEEATAIYRRLAARRGGFESELARSLEDLSRLQARREDALAATEEATAIHRRLAAEHDALEPALAASLSDLSGRLAALGRSDEAITAIQEAIAIRRRLATQHDVFAPDLARSLTDLSLRMAALGRPEDALAAVEEATTIYRRAAGTQSYSAPDGFEPALAMALTNLSLRLAGLGRREEALAAVEEATSICRRVVAAMAAAARQGAYEPNLAMTLTNLSLRRADLHRHEEALTAIEEAIAIFRHLFATRRGAFQRELAASLTNLSLCLAELGRREDALSAIEEAITIFRRLFATRGGAFEPDLATSLWAMGWVQDKLDLPTEAGIAAVRESLSARSPGAPPASAAALTLVRLLDRVGRVDEATALRERYGLDPNGHPSRPSIELGALNRPSHGTRRVA